MKTSETNKNTSVLQKENASKAGKNLVPEVGLAVPFFQPKLSVNAPDDIYEKEADAVAEEVMRIPVADHFFKPATAVISRVCDDCEREEELKRKELPQAEPVIEPLPKITEVIPVIHRKEEEEERGQETVTLQRKCSHCEEEEKLQRQEEKEEEETMLSLKPLGTSFIQKKCAECEKEEKESVQRKETDSSGEFNTSRVEQVLGSFGQPMNNEVRGFMEERFGYDFGSVQIHNDSPAHQSSSDINARAYTHQNHIVFGAGEYQPDTASGKQLLAHELTHVVQQGAAGKSDNSTQKKINRSTQAASIQLQPAPAKATSNKGKINFHFDKEVIDNYIWTSPWGAISVVQHTPLGKSVLDELDKAGIEIDILFVADVKKIPVGGDPLGLTLQIAPGKFKIFVLVAQINVNYKQTKQGSMVATNSFGARSMKEISDTLFHELLHAWFMTSYPNAIIPTGHTGKALPLDDPKFNPKEYDPVFLDKLKKFQGQLGKIMPKRNGLQLKCSDCGEEDQIQEKELIQRSSFSLPEFSYEAQSNESSRIIQPKFINQAGSVSLHIQTKPVEEPKKYEGIIDYKKARKDNLDTWYQNYKFFNFFKEAEVYPGSTPIAYANHVYELQLKLEIFRAGDWEANEPGILTAKITTESELVQLLLYLQEYAKDKKDIHGVGTAMLDRMQMYTDAVEANAPPLTSEYFSGVSQLEAVNKNKYFHINFDDRGEYVVRLQNALMQLNYDIGSDAKLNADKEKEASGIFGAGTKGAVINFQKDSGFVGDEVDGVVGQMTLRFLDKRLGTPVFKPSTEGNVYAFHVPVYQEDLLKKPEEFKEELLIRTLTVAFPIDVTKADVLKRSSWHWVKYHELTKEETDQGYQRVTIPKTSYESIIGKLQGGDGTGKDISEELEIQGLDLLKTTHLGEVIKKIKAKELERAYAMMSYGGSAEGKRTISEADRREMKKDQEKIDAISKEIEALVKERDEILRSLDITLEDYEKMQIGFVENFEKFAAQTVFKMLAENEMQANIEYEHYKNLSEVQAIKAILSDLSVKYKDSEKFWWEAVSLQDSNGKNSSLYKNNSDYYLQNSETFVDEGGGHTVDFSDPDKYYNEETVAKRYQAEEKTSTPYYKNWQEKEKQVVTTLQDAVKKFPILAYPKLSLRNNAGKKAAMDDAALQKHLQNIISDKDDGGIKENIESVRQKIKSDYKQVWSMPIVIMRAKMELGIVKDTVLDDLINEKQKQVNDKSFWESIGLAVLGIGLGLLALASGPVGWLALGASIAVGAYDAYKTYEDITFKKQTANTAIDPADALGTDDPSYFWFWVSLVCVGLDVLQAAKLIKSISKASVLAKDVGEGLTASRKLLETELEAVGHASERGKQILKEMEEIDAALTKVKTTEFVENQKFLEPLKSNPMAVVVMSQALKDKKIVKAVAAAGKMLDKETFETVLKFYSGIGRKSMDELPELMRLIQGSELSKTAIKEILTDTRIQRVLLDTQDVAAFAKQHEAWQAAVKGGESISFIQFLEKQGLKPGFAGDTRLIDMFGEAFAKLPSATKNRQILRTIEPALLDAFNAGKLPPQLQKAMEVIIHSDVLAESARLSSAQQRFLYELKTMGSVIETQSDLTKVMQLLNNPTARKALWDGASQLAGKEEYMAKIFTILKDKPLSPDVFDDMIRIGPMTDTGTIEMLLQESSKEIRKLLAASPEAVAVLKKCASPCLPAFLKGDDILLVQKIMKGKSAEDTLKIREYLYGLRDDEALFKQALKDMEVDYAKVIKDVKLPALAKPVKLKAANDALRRIIDLGLPVSELNKIMANASKVAAGDEIIYDLMKVLELEKSVSSPNFGKLLGGLASTNPEEFRVARHLLDESASFVHASEIGATKFKYTGLQKADALLGRFTLAELGSLMNTRWGEGFINHVYDLTHKMPGIKNAELLDLAGKAGSGGKGDLGRLKAIVDSLGKSTVTLDEAAKAIEAANSFKSNIAKALKDPATGFDAMAKLIWGEKAVISGENVKIGEALSHSGSAILDTATGLGKADSVAENLLTASGKLDPAKWEVFKKVINGADIEQILKNKLIGDMWGLANIKALEKQGYKLGSSMFTEITLSTGKIQARADAILIKGNEIIVVEFKTGGNVYRKGQTEIYQLLKEGQSKALMVMGNEDIATKFANAEVKITYQAIEESAVVGVH